MRDIFRKIIVQDNKELERIEKARKKFESRENKKNLRELKRYEKVLDKGLGLDREWL